MDKHADIFLYTNTFRAYVRRHTGELYGRSAHDVADIIHMSRYDARLKLKDGAERYAPGSQLEFRVLPKGERGAGGKSSVAAQASVNWVQCDEMGLSFPTPLELGPRELQNLLD